MSDRMVNLRKKARILSQIRAFFDARNVLEVDVPCLDLYPVSDPYLSNFVCQWQSTPLYLQTSPEYAMKRLLADGFGDCYYLGKAFRNEACSPHHSPEFMLLEWYRQGFNPAQLIAEITALLSAVLDVSSVSQMTYTNAFRTYADIDIESATTDELIRAFPGEASFDLHAESRDDLLQVLFSMLVEPHIGQDIPCFITDFPIGQAALAQANADGKTAQRFELYYRGFELANGYGELTDPDEQARRFHADNSKRRQLGIPEVDVDTRLLEALNHGLPPCSGVALGIDRLCMIALNLNDINDIQYR